jgi:uncharacterized membrane protein
MNLNFDTRLSQVAGLYAKKLNAKITVTSLKEAIEQNPYYPSLYSLSNVFDRFGIENKAFKIDTKEFNELEAPFLAYISHQGTPSDFVLVTAITNAEVSYEVGADESFQVTKERFLNDYRKIVFVAEPNEKSGETDYKIKLNKEKNIAAKRKLLMIGASVVVSLFFILLLYPFIQNPAGNTIWSAFLIMAAKIVGVITAVLLLVYETDKSNSFVKSICSAGKQTNCDAVLSSKASKVLGVSWADIGFFYFASTTLFLLLPGVSFEAKTTPLAFATSLVSPYILFSLYYQWKVVKQWCPLCLAAQAALALELVWSVLFFWMSDKNTVHNEIIPMTFLAIICILLPVIVWNLLKPVLLNAKDTPTYKAAYKRLLHNPEMFDALLQQQPEAIDGWQNLGIGIGNPNAKHTIIKVCNPYCGPCAKAHPVLEEIVAHNSDYNMRIIFTATNSPSDPRGVVVKHLLAVDSKGDAKQTAQAVDEWYKAEQKSYEKFAAKYPMNEELKQQDAKVEAMDKWCREAEIAFTPTIFVKGKRLPETYGVEELKNIL